MMRPPDVVPGSYNGDKIELLGYFESTIRFKEKGVIGKIYVSVSGPDILGWHHQACLDLILQPGCVPQITTPEHMLTLTDNASTNVVSGHNTNSASDLVKDFQLLFSEGLGKISNFQHNIKVKHNVLPVKHKLRCVPYSMRSELNAQIKQLCKDNIIEPVESSLWQSPIVVNVRTMARLDYALILEPLIKPYG